jgi:ABC-type multidrug transport system fused ATPase/permease subunit
MTAALHILHQLLRLTSAPRYSTPVMIVLGLLSSLAETLGVSLVVLFIYSAMGEPRLGETTGGLFGVLLDRIGSQLGASTTLAFVLFLLIVARGLLGLAYSVICAAIGQHVSESVRNSLHEQYFSVSYEFIRKHEQGKLLEILATESWSVAAAHASFTRVVVNLCSIAVFLTVLFVLSWKITALALAGGLVVTLAVRLLSTPIRALGAEVKQINVSLAAQILVSLQGMRTIRAFGQEANQHARFRLVSADARAAALKLDRLSSIVHPVTEMAYLAILCAIIGLGAYANVPFPTILATVALLYRLQPHVRELEGAVLYLAQLEPQLGSVLAMLDPTDKTYAPAGFRSAVLKEAVRFDGVTFAYDPGRGASLKAASFTIPAGAVTALVGASGAGKTTVVNLLLRLYQPDCGVITVDGVPLNEISRLDWLGMLTVAGQDVELVEGTIAENIRMARNKATAPEIAGAGEVAGLAQMVAGLPEGYDTWIGQEGLNLSGGQRQRIGLARAVIRHPQLLILDEATSELDFDLEKQVRAAICRRFSDRTILLITHRLETLSSVDHVICIENGQVRGEGRASDVLPGTADGPARNKAIRAI